MTEFTSTAIDLVFVNNTHRIVSHGVQEFGASDHSVTFVVKKAGVCKAHVEIRDVRSFKHYNKNHFRRDIASVPWSVIESFDDINDAVVAWNNLFVDVANQHAPGRLLMYILRELEQNMRLNFGSLVILKN